MAEQPPRSPSGVSSLPDNPDLDWLRRQAKRTLGELRTMNPAARLTDAQFDVAKSYGFASWRALKAHVDSLTVDGQLFVAARDGNLSVLTTLLDEHPDHLLARDKPYEHTLLHIAARHGQLAVVELLLARGIDPNVREKGDNTYPMHWAAAAGHVDVVQRLADAGGDVVGHGDDHELEVIGWATCWNGSDDAAHRAVADFLVVRGARHHIFSAIAMNLAAEVKRIVAENPSAITSRMSRNESNQTPLHFAVRMRRPAMVRLLLALGADPLAVDAAGQTIASYAEHTDIDRPVMEAIRAMTLSEMTSADRGRRSSRAGTMDLAAALTLGDWALADRLARDNPQVLERGGVLHLMAQRNDTAAVEWLLARGADPNARSTQYESEVTALHMAAGGGAMEVARLLLAAGADPRIRDTRFDGDAIGWAEHFDKPEMRELLQAHMKES